MVAMHRTTVLQKSPKLIPKKKVLLGALFGAIWFKGTLLSLASLWDWSGCVWFESRSDRGIYGPAMSHQPIVLLLTSVSLSPQSLFAKEKKFH